MSLSKDDVDILGETLNNGLLPCPFCGGNARIYTMKLDDGDAIMNVGCVKCDAQLEDYLITADNINTLISGWNKRVFR